MPGQAFFLIAGESLGGHALDARVELDGVLREQSALRDDEDVVAALPQGRQVEVDHVEAVVEVLAEAPGADLLLEDPIGRGDDPDVDLLGLAVADAKDDALLERAQQLDLEVQRELADLVEEERPPVRRLELARTRGDRPGERAAHVPEELALDEVLRDRAAVDDDERARQRGCCDGGSRAR